jgi:ketosteroid isomerase-like protein
MSLLATPTDDVPSDVPSDVTDAHAPLATVRAACRAWAARDEEALRELLHECTLWRTAEGSPYTGAYRGPDAVVTLLRRMAEDWPQWDADVEAFPGTGDQVVAIGTYRGRSARTGRSMETRFAQLWTVRDGRVMGHEEIVDGSRLLAALIPGQPSIP